MQGLKILVISLGVLIMITLGLLGYGVYKKAADPDTVLLTPDSKAPWKGRHKGWKPPEPFGNVDITLPPGCQIENVIPTRGRRLFLQLGPQVVAGGPLCESIIIINVRDGTVLGTINIKSQP